MSEGCYRILKRGVLSSLHGGIELVLSCKFTTIGEVQGYSRGLTELSGGSYGFYGVLPCLLVYFAATIIHVQ